jgi:hypothetical protein
VQLLRHQADDAARGAIVANDIVTIDHDGAREVGVTMPQTMLISVVLPAPFGPSSAKISPFGDLQAHRLERMHSRGIGLTEIEDG